MSDQRGVLRSIAIIVAMDRNRLIGRGGQLPWKLPEDMRHFRRTTMGKTVLMGRKTWDSLGKPLEGRDNWVLTRGSHFAADGVRVFQSLDEALAAHGEGELMVIGGGEIYRQALPYANRLYLTCVDAALEGDAHFPDFDPLQFNEVSREVHVADGRHAHPFAFVTLERK